MKQAKISVRLSKNTKNKLDMLAREKNQTISQYVRGIINRSFETKDILDKLEQIRWLIEKMPSSISSSSNSKYEALLEGVKRAISELRVSQSSSNVQELEEHIKAIRTVLSYVAYHQPAAHAALEREKPDILKGWGPHIDRW